MSVYPLMETEMMTSSDDSRLQVNLEMPTGTPLPRVLEETRRVEDLLLATPEVENIFTTLGAGSRQEQHKGSIYVDLVDKTERERTKFEIQDDLREQLTLTPGVRIVVGDVSEMGGMGAYDYEFELTGYELDELVLVADRFVSTLSQTAGFRDVGQTFESGKPEIRVEIDRDRAADLGVDALTLGSTLNLLVSGEQPVTTFEEGGEQYDVRLRLEESFRDRPEDLLSLEVPGSHGERRELAGFVTIHTAEGPSEIRHSRGMRMIQVHTNLEIPLGSATHIVEGLFDELVPHGMKARVTGMADIMRESFESMGFALILAILLVYMILAAQYNHFVHPLTIMISLPLAFVGAFGLLFICNMTVNIFSLIGLIMLMGLVTKNAVLVVDLTNQYRAQGMERDEALMEAGPIRLRPVLMTTFAMIGGMLPVALMLGGGAGSEMRAPMAVVVIGGLITSTLLTLIVVPVVYALFDIATDWFVKRVLRIR
jgi:HAE1 family hydrophobic/amphiphilic exporter-1